MKDTRSEKQIQQDIVSALRVLNIPHTVSDVGLMRDKQGNFKFKRGTQGWPDISAVLPDGKFLGIEVKSAKGKVSEQQVSMHGTLIKSNAIIIVARSASEVFNFIEGYIAR